MRIRLGPVPARPEPTVGGDHICLVLPALDEAGRIGEVIRRLPPVVGGLPTRCLVVDDGSTDATAAETRAAGAQVLAMGRQQGLGAAIRAGLRTSVERGAAIVAFCDADGEYAPEELPRLAEPILRGRADYVVGSRFSGVIESMRPHRRLGNGDHRPRLQLRPGPHARPARQGLRLWRGADHVPLPAKWPIIHPAADLPSARCPGCREAAVCIGRSVLHDVIVELLPGAVPRIRIDPTVRTHAFRHRVPHRERVMGVVMGEQRLAPDEQELVAG